MKSYSHLRLLIWTSACVAALFAVPGSFGKAADRPVVQAQVLDHAEYLCDNCFFGPSYYYYCFEADNKVLIAYQRTPVINWEDKSKNYLTRAHKAWMVWTPPAQTVPISYDDKHIWVSRPDGKSVRLIQNYSQDIFRNNDRCRDVVKAQTH
jgi:hypothetical protein